MSGNPIKYYHHISGPRRKVVCELWDSDGRGWSLLECGHAVPSRYRGAKHKRILMSPGRQCLLCNKYSPPEEKVRKFEYLDSMVVEQALLEGKRRRAAFYFKERGKDVPTKLQRQRCRMALYDDPNKVVPV